MACLALVCSVATQNISNANTTENFNTYNVYLLIRPTPKGDYLTQLLYSALNASKKADEKIAIIFNNTDLSQARWIAELQKSQHNYVIWTVTTPEREAILHPIRIPLLRGLYGYRVLVIRPETAALFAKINSIEQLTKLSAGMNPHWPDANIFHTNGLPFVEGTFASNLYRMLAAGRFDYFPRGVLEITEEQPLIDSNHLQLEQELLIYYPSFLYFFVNKDNQELIDRLEHGLQIMLDNGEFDRLFYNHPAVAAALNRLGKRRVISINNPLHPKGATEFPPEYFRRLQVSSSSAATGVSRYSEFLHPE